MTLPVSFISQQFIDDFGLPISNLKFSANIVMNMNTILTTPANSRFYEALIKIPDSTVPVFFSVNSAAVPLLDAAFMPTNGELIGSNGICRYVKSGDLLNFYAVNAQSIVSVSFYGFEQAQS